MFHGSVHWNLLLFEKLALCVKTLESLEMRTCLARVPTRFTGFSHYCRNWRLQKNSCLMPGQKCFLWFMILDFFFRFNITVFGVWWIHVCWVSESQAIPLTCYARSVRLWCLKVFGSVHNIDNYFSFYIQDFNSSSSLNCSNLAILHLHIYTQMHKMQIH